MAEITNKPISAIDESTQAAIRRSSAASLPYNPSEKGFKPADIINMLYKPIIDGTNSVINEINRIARESNTAIEDICNQINEALTLRDNADKAFWGKYEEEHQKIYEAITAAGIISIVHEGVDENGGNIYTVSYNSGITSEIVAPKGDKGDTGNGVTKIEYEGTDANGGNIYKQTYTDGTTFTFIAPKGDKGIQGDKGDDLAIYQSFLSIEEMEAAVDDIPLHKIVLIDTVDPAHTDNAKLFVRSREGFSFLKKVDVTLRDIPVSTGEQEESLVLFEGKATAKYSVAGGTDDKEAAGELADMFSLANIAAELPVAEKPLGISFGVGSKALSTAGTAIGINSISGVRGYYWWRVSGNTFELSVTRNHSLKAKQKPSSLDWAKGDYLCVVNKNKYPFIATITSVDTENMTVTVDSLPQINKAAFADQYTILSVMAPDDMTIFAIRRATNSLTGHVEFTARSGDIELAWGATVIGALGVGAGTLSSNFGYSNCVYDFGFVSGRENMCGYASLVGGSNNVDRGLYNLMAGRNNYIGPNTSSVVCCGWNNKIYSGNSVIFGYNNEIKESSASSILVGDGLKATVWTQAGFGRYNNYNESKSDLLVVGCGSSDSNRKNAFRVTSAGKAYSGGGLLLGTKDRFLDERRLWYGSLSAGEYSFISDKPNQMHILCEFTSGYNSSFAFAGVGPFSGAGVGKIFCDGYGFVDVSISANLEGDAIYLSWTASNSIDTDKLTNTTLTNIYKM